MNVITSAQQGLSNLINQLQKQKDELTATYHLAIDNGKKYDEVRTIYITLQDIDKRLSDLMRVAF